MPRRPRCRMAQHCDSFAGIEQDRDEHLSSSRENIAELRHFNLLFDYATDCAFAADFGAFFLPAFFLTRLVIHPSTAMSLPRCHSI